MGWVNGKAEAVAFVDAIKKPGVLEEFIADNADPVSWNKWTKKAELALATGDAYNFTYSYCRAWLTTGVDPRIVGEIAERELDPAYAELAHSIAYAASLDVVPVVHISREVAISAFLTRCPKNAALVNFFPAGAELILESGYCDQVASIFLTDTDCIAHGKRMLMTFPSDSRVEVESKKFADVLDYDPKSVCDLCIDLINNIGFLLEQNPEFLVKKPNKKRKGRRAHRFEKEDAPNVYFVNPQGVWGDCPELTGAFRQMKTGSEYRIPKWFRRGHWRNQPCGPGLSEVKKVLVPPSWCHRSKFINECDGAP